MAVINLAPGRPLPDLLFVTTAKLGREATAALKKTVGDRLVVLDPTPPSAEAAMTTVRQRLQDLPTIVGVVLIGGYDTLPPRRMDALDAPLRERLMKSSHIRQDQDRFYVWNDDIYGDRDGDIHGLAELPVSRIPDGSSSAFTVGALQAPTRVMPAPRRGIRNCLRPYAEDVYAMLPGSDQMGKSGPDTADLLGADALAADRVYFALHGEYDYPDRFKGGAKEGDQPIAVRIDSVPEQSGAVVLAACCWSALIVDQAAAIGGRPEALTSRTEQTSIALRFIERGATAFVGFTGSHYAPRDGPPYDYFGRPLHAAFWRNVVERGLPPAQALFEAKAEYIVAAPHGRTDDVSLACEMKTFWSATCLGLGW